MIITTEDCFVNRLVNNQHTAGFKRVTRSGVGACGITSLQCTGSKEDCFGQVDRHPSDKTRHSRSFAKDPH